MNVLISIIILIIMLIADLIIMTLAKSKKEIWEGIYKRLR